MALKWCTKVEAVEEVPYWFFRSSIKFQGHTGQKNRWFWPELSISELELQFEFTDGVEMMHKARCSIEEVVYYFLRSSIKFQGHRGWKMYDLNSIRVRLLGRSQLSNPSDLPCLKSVAISLIQPLEFLYVNAGVSDAYIAPMIRVIINSVIGLPPSHYLTNSDTYHYWDLWGTNFSKIGITISWFSFRKMHLKMSSTWIWVIIGSCIDLLSDDTKPSSESMLTCH